MGSCRRNESEETVSDVTTNIGGFPTLLGLAAIA